MPPFLPICLRGNSHPIIWEHPASRGSREPPCLLRWDRTSHGGIGVGGYWLRGGFEKKLGWEVGGSRGRDAGEGCVPAISASPPPQFL